MAENGGQAGPAPIFASARRLGDAAGMTAWTRATWLVLSTRALACGGDDSDDGATTNPSTSVTVADDDDDDDDGPSTSAEDPSTSSDGGSTGPQPESSSGPAPESSTGADESESTGPINFCDPVVPGEWNSCHDEEGMVDNTLCNYVGSGEFTGTIGCLGSGETKGANVCFISGCVDTCDCFAPPTTGTAEVICGPILEGGGNGCGLDCSSGRMCPDGMECIGTLCFWAPV